MEAGREKRLGDPGKKTQELRGTSGKTLGKTSEQMEKPICKVEKSVGNSREDDGQSGRSRDENQTDMGISPLNMAGFMGNLYGYKMGI